MCANSYRVGGGKGLSGRVGYKNAALLTCSLYIKLLNFSFWNFQSKFILIPLLYPQIENMLWFLFMMTESVKFGFKVGDEFEKVVEGSGTQFLFQWIGFKIKVVLFSFRTHPCLSNSPEICTWWF